jgi:hypothetical protein
MLRSLEPGLERRDDLVVAGFAHAFRLKRRIILHDKQNRVAVGAVLDGWTWP